MVVGVKTVAIEAAARVAAARGAWFVGRECGGRHLS
jgi:hypothetical protein